MDPSATPRSKRLEQGDRSKEEILDVATQMMSARGYDGTSISALAKESGLSASSIYWHFSSKAGVLSAVMERGSAGFMASSSLADIPANGSRLEKVTAILERGAEAVAAHPEFIRLELILLLNAPAGVVDESVARSRTQEREGLREALAYAYSDLGSRRASLVADGLVHFARATFEGSFLAAQAGTTSAHNVIRQLAQALVAMADEIIASDTAPSAKSAAAHPRSHQGNGARKAAVP